MNHDRRLWLYIFLSMQLVLALISAGIEAVHFQAVHHFYTTLRDTGRHIGVGSYHEPAIVYSWVKYFSILVFWIPFWVLLIRNWDWVKQSFSGQIRFLCFVLITFSVCGEVVRTLVVSEFGNTHEHDLNLEGSLSYIQTVFFPVFIVNSVFALLSPLVGLWGVYQANTMSSDDE